MKRKQKIVAIAAVLALATCAGINSGVYGQTFIRYNDNFNAPYMAAYRAAQAAAAARAAQAQQQAAEQRAAAQAQQQQAQQQQQQAAAQQAAEQQQQAAEQQQEQLLKQQQQELQQQQQQAAAAAAAAAAAQAAATAQAAASIEQNISNLAAEFSVKPNSTSAGMGFDLPGLGGNPGGGPGWNPPGSNSVQASSGTALSFNDPNIVDAANVPSGLPKSVSDAITADYAKSPPDVRGWVRKGYENVMNHDWPAAKACFQQAQLEDPKSDPENQGIGRLIGLADFTMAHEGIDPTAAPYSGLGPIPPANPSSAAQPAPAPLPSLTFSGPPGIADGQSAAAPAVSATKKPGIDQIYVPVPTPEPRTMTQKFFDLLKPAPEPERPVTVMGVRG